MDIETKMRQEFVLYMVQRQIWCPFTNDVLDIRTVKWFVDKDGDPAYVVSPRAYEAIVGSDKSVEGLASKGLYPMP
jgi:hypothetical protein